MLSRPPRVAAIHDLSGFGRCSLTVAIPVLSAMGVQCCPLPTAFLSTHTGGFQGFTFLDMTEELPKVADHWKSLGLQFQAIYSGFLGSGRQIGIVADFIRQFRGPDTLVVVDPVMGDDGKPYQTYPPAMCAGMARLAELAEKAAGGGEEDRAALQKELTRLLGEIDRMAGSAAGDKSLFLSGDPDAAVGADALPAWLLNGIAQGAVSPERLLSALGLDQTASGADILAAIMGS